MRALTKVSVVTALALFLLVGCGDLYYSLFSPEPENADVEQVFVALRNSWKEVYPFPEGRYVVSDWESGTSTSADEKVTITLSTETEDSFTIYVAHFVIKDYTDPETGITVVEADFTAKSREFVDFKMRKNLTGTAKVTNAGTVEFVRFEVWDSYPSWEIYNYFDMTAFNSTKYHYVWGELSANGRDIDQGLVELPGFPPG
jgi:hypothetical protein